MRFDCSRPIAVRASVVALVASTWIACAAGTVSGSTDPNGVPTAENCTNGIDDDKNGVTDCADPACTGSPDCTADSDCGNDLRNGAETCDGDDLGGQSCVRLGYDSGNLACNATCDGYITTGCISSSTCGDAQIESPEVCDGANVGTVSCQTLGFDSGAIGCKTDCTGFNVSQCSTSAHCGDSLVGGPEICDGANLNGTTCMSLGFDSGTLVCRADCLGFDLSACVHGCVSTPTQPCETPDETLYQQALALYEAHDYAGAKPLFDQLWVVYPSSIRHDNAGYYRGRCRYELLDYAGAIAAFATLRAVHPTSIILDQAMYWSGKSRYELASYAAAIPDFQASLGYDPSGPYADNAAYYIGKCYYELGAPAKDPTYLSQAVTSFTAFLNNSAYASSAYRPDAYYFLGKSYYDLGNFTSALTAFQSVAAGSQYADNAAYYVGKCHYDLGEPTTDITELSSAIASFNAFLANPSYAGSSYRDDAYYYLGKSYFLLAQYASAITAFQSVLAMAGSQYADNAEYYIGRSYYALGDLGNALTAFQTVVSTYPTSQYADNALYYEVRVYTDQGNCAAANTALAKLQADYPLSIHISGAESYMSNNGC